MIGPFKDQYEFLSNFDVSPVELDGVLYPTVEHAFQAAKTLDTSDRDGIFNALTPGKAKRLGRKVTLRFDWDAVKVGIMAELLWQKFENPDLRDKLLTTGDEVLVEMNWWHDNFWGVCEGGPKCSCTGSSGNNFLGRLLMSIRKKIRDGIEP